LTEVDGQRVTEEGSAALAEAGLEIILIDAMPDILLWNPQNKLLWVID
jgi:hypothetical protein